MIPIELVVFVACFVAGLSRAILPYIRKRQEAEASGSEVEFQKSYFFTAVLSILIASIGGLLLFPAVIDTVPSGASLFAVFVTAFVAAWGMNDMLNQVVATGSSSASTIFKVKPKEENPQ